MLKNELGKTVQANARLSETKATLEDKLSKALTENRELSERMEVMHTRMQERLAFSGKIGEEYSLRKELTSLRSQLRSKKAEIDSLLDDKQEMRKDLKNLEAQLKQASAEMERATEDYSKMKQALVSSDNILKDKQNECERLQTELERITGGPSGISFFDSKIMQTLDEKVAEWTALLSTREEENAKLYEENDRLKQDLDALKIDKDLTSVHALVRTMKEKDDQIMRLKEQLIDAAREVSESTVLLGEVKKTLGPEEGEILKIERVKRIQKNLQEKENLVFEMERRMKLLETQIETKDEEIRALEERIRRYETGEYGLAEALGEWKATKLELVAKERQLDEVCQAAGQAESNANQLMFENDCLRQRLGISPDEDINIDGFISQRRIKEDETKALNMVLQGEIEKLENERLDLKQKLREMAKKMVQNSSTNDLGLQSLLSSETVYEEKSEYSHILNIMQVQSANRLQGSAPTTEVPEVWHNRVKAANEEISRLAAEVEKERLLQQKAAAKLNLLTELNVQLEAGLSELQETLKTHPKASEDSAVILECPVLGKLLAALDARSFMEDSDNARFLKCRVDYLEVRYHFNNQISLT
ncbi:unnamed protein product [Dibothriocephalus latus]|uniref:Uncharacterized protein n=1 Tax=Dibothriocephalus latus TaxID=60516 RepID=A0A3P7M9D8_DIBLA|nr:unnamed protein product [Dibothriocephalus latus]